MLLATSVPLKLMLIYTFYFPLDNNRSFWRGVFPGGQSFALVLTTENKQS